MRESTRHVAQRADVVEQRNVAERRRPQRLTAQRATEGDNGRRDLTRRTTLQPVIVSG